MASYTEYRPRLVRPGLFAVHRLPNGLKILSGLADSLFEEPSAWCNVDELKRIAPKFLRVGKGIAFRCRADPDVRPRYRYSVLRRSGGQEKKA
jgi:hypothetical protein